MLTTTNAPRPATLVAIEPRASFIGVPALRPATIRELDELPASKLSAKVNENLRLAYDGLMSAGGILLTMHNSAQSARELETVEALRRICRDCACDVSLAAYKAPMIG